MKFEGSIAPINLTLSGPINQIDLVWRIQPILKDLKENNFDDLYEKLYRLKSWSKTKKVAFKLKANFLFRSAFYFFCKMKEHN